MLNTVKTKKTTKNNKPELKEKVEPLSQDQIKKNIFFLENLQRLAFNNDHPGIDKMVNEMEKQMENLDKRSEEVTSTDLKEGKQSKGGVNKKPKPFLPPPPPKKGT